LVRAHLRGLTVNDPSRRHYPGLAATPLFFRTASGELVRFDAATYSSEAASPGAAQRSRKATLRGLRTYLDPRVTASIQALSQAHGFDHTKLLRLIAELDDNFARDNAYAAHAPLRAILDHIPPMLGCTSFTAVANNYPWTRTDREIRAQPTRLQGPGRRRAPPPDLQAPRPVAPGDMPLGPA
jgi:hypothetical protein